MAKIYELCCILLLAVSISWIPQATSDIGVYELRKGNFSVKLTNYGATIISVVVPDRNGPGINWFGMTNTSFPLHIYPSGNLDDIVLGFDSLEDYKTDTTYFGAIVGRVANRIKGAQFLLKGRTYKLVPNDGENTLHGGPKGFSDVVWQVSSYQTDSHVTFTYNSSDGEGGFPGALRVSVTYALLPTKQLTVTMRATPLNKPTPVNLASHTYWNLGGHGSGDVFSHQLRLYADKFTPVDHELIPTGEIRTVKGTPYDFLKIHEIGTKFHELPDGYDINYVLEYVGDAHVHKAAVVYERKTGRKLEVWTNQPGMQLYTSNGLGTVKGKGGVVYNKYGGICLETQGFPDAVNQPSFPSQIVKPGESYSHVMIYKFSAK